jgi:predicted kinase
MSIVVLTGAPGAGKSTIARAVAPLRRRCSVIEVDDVRQMLVQPHAAPWAGAEGLRQQKLGVSNAAQLAIGFADDGADVVIADVVNNETAGLYRRTLAEQGVQIVHLRVSEALARDRTAGRHYSLMDDEMRALHMSQANFVDFDRQLDTSVMSVSHAALQVCEILERAAGGAMTQVGKPSHSYSHQPFLAELVPRQATLALLMVAARLMTLRSRGSVVWWLRQAM